jgi:hypothetical protein
MIERVDPNHPFGPPPSNTGAEPPSLGNQKLPGPQTGTQSAIDQKRLEKLEQDIQSEKLGGAAKPLALPEKVVSYLSGNITALQEIDDALEAVSERPQSIGIGTGWVGDTATQMNDPEGTKTRAKLGRVGAVLIHDLSGAAVSASEQPRFTPFVPKPDDKPQVARDKLLVMRSKIEKEMREVDTFYSPANSYIRYSTPGMEWFRSSPETERIIDEPISPFKGGQRNPDVIGAIGEQGQVSTSLNLEDLPNQGASRPGGPIVPADPAKPGPGNLFNTSSEPGLEVNITGGPRPSKSERAADPALDAKWRRIEIWEAGGPDPADQERAEKLRESQDAARLKIEDTMPFGLGSADGPRERLFKHGMQFGLSDEAAGVGNALANPFSPFESYRAGRDVEEGRLNEAKAETGWQGTAAEIAGNVVSLNPEAIAANLGRTAMLTQTAKQGGALSALAGYGEGRGAQESLGNAATYGATGAFTAPILPELGRLAVAGGRKARNALTTRGLNPELAAAATANRVDLRRPMVDPKTQELAGNLEGSPGASQIIRGGYDKTEKQIEAGLTRLSTGAAGTEREGAGRIVQNSATRFMRDTDRRAKVNYGRARQLAGTDAAITPRTALAQLRQELLDFKGTENISADQVAFIERVGADLTKGPVTIKQFQRIRRELNEAINRGELRGSEADRATQRIINALRDDLHDSLPRPAARKFLEADAQYTKDMKFQNDIILPFVAKNAEGELKMSSSQAMSKLEAWAAQKGGDPERLQAFWSNMKPGERQDVLASVIGAIGKPNREAPFSAAHFVTQVSGLSNSARRTMFGAEGAQRVNELVELSKALKDARSRINFPGSGRTVKQHIGGMVVSMLLGGAAGGGGTANLKAAAGAAVGLGAKTGYDALRAKALMNPEVAHWLADVAKAATPAQMNDKVRKLGIIIARQPASMRDELEPLKAQLEEEFGGAEPERKLTAEDTM